MKKRLVILCLYGLLSRAWGEPIIFNPAAPQRYVVVCGDTLWNIAARFLRDPWRWPEIWHTPPQSKNPHLIYPGDIISLRYREKGQPLLTLQRGLPIYKISPKTHVIELEKAIPTIPTEVIQPFLVYPQVVSKEVLENAPYIVAGTEGRLILGAGDKAYVRGLSDKMPVQYGLYRRGDIYRDPAHPDEILGYEALFIADIEVRRFGDPASVYIQSSTREVLVGDRLLPRSDQKLEPYFFPHVASLPVEGKIIAAAEGVSHIGQNQVVVLNLGAEDGIEKGVVLGVYQAGREVRDIISRRPGDRVQLPDERTGTIMVFRVFDRISYALVMRAKQAIHFYDTVRNP